jgi:sucrose-phosphate synthase
LLVDPLNTDEIAGSLIKALSDRDQWRRWSRNGVAGVKRHYTWEAHVSKYIKQVATLLHREKKRARRQLMNVLREGKSPMPLVPRVLISDIDSTLIGDEPGLRDLMQWLRRNADELAFGVATGRSLDSAIRVLREHRVLMPDVWVTAVGTEIYYGRELSADRGWRNHIRYLWRRDAVFEALRGTRGLKLQARENQREFKLSYNVDPEQMPTIEELRSRLRAHGLHAHLIWSHGTFLDVLPVRASKGQAIRYLAHKWGLPLRSFLVAGDSGNDSEMLVGDTLGVVVGNHSPELEVLRGLDQIYFADRPSAAGILEGIARYGFAERAVPAT